MVAQQLNLHDPCVIITFFLCIIKQLTNANLHNGNMLINIILKERIPNIKGHVGYGLSSKPLI